MYIYILKMECNYFMKEHIIILITELNLIVALVCVMY